MGSKSTIIVAGYLASDPETAFTPTGMNYLKFSIPVSTKRQGEESTTWFRCTSWGKAAEGLDKLASGGYLAKGSAVEVVGRLEAREYTDKNGATRTSLDVNASDVTFIAPPKTAPQGQQQTPGSFAESLDDVPFD